MNIHTISRDKELYDAKAIYDNGKITVLKGSKINLRNANGFVPPSSIALLRNDKSLFDKNGFLVTDVKFSNLSSAATFVTGRIANGMIVWKTDDGKYIRYSLCKEGNDAD